MEKSILLLRKVNTFLEPTPNTQDISHSLHDSPQHALFQLSETDAPLPLQMRPVNVDPWLTSDYRCQLNDKPKITQPFRRTVHLKPTHSRSWKPTEPEGSSENSLQKSIIPKLKNLLQKLQSPQKKNGQSSSKEQNNFLAEGVVETPEFFGEKKKPSQHTVSIRIKNRSSEKSRKCMGSFKEGRTEVVFSRNRPSKAYCLNFQAHLNVIRQARRKRTLKNLLF